MSSELVLGIIGTITGIVGTIIGLTTLILKRIQEKPNLKISDMMVSLQKMKDNIDAEVSFNVDNIGDRATTVTRLNMILGPDVEVKEELKAVSAHSSIRIPEEPNSSIRFSFPKDIKFLDGTQGPYFEKEEKLKVTVSHTHGEVEKSYELPPSSEWEKQAIYKNGPLVLFLN